MCPLIGCIHFLPFIDSHSSQPRKEESKISSGKIYLVPPSTHAQFYVGQQPKLNVEVACLLRLNVSYF